MSTLRSFLVLALLIALPGCELVAGFDRDKIPLPGTGLPTMDGGGWDPPPPHDAGLDPEMDAGLDAGPSEAGTDAGPDAGLDGGADAGPTDAGTDAGDAGDSG